MNSIDSFTLFLEQHQQIKEAAKQAQIVLERIKEQGTEEGYQDVLDKLLHLKTLLVDHGRQEEEVIVPLVKEMYRSPEMAQYVEEEHTQMEEDLKEIKNQLRLHIG